MKKFNHEMLIGSLVLLLLGLGLVHAALQRSERGALAGGLLLLVFALALFCISRDVPESSEELLAQRQANAREAWAIEQRARRRK